MNTITHTSGFSKDRFFQLTKRTLILNQKKWGIGIAGALGVLFLIWLLTTFLWTSHPQPGIAVIGMGMTFYQFGGYFLTAGIFSELNSRAAAPQLLTLPATTFEKLFTAWFLSYLVYTVVVIGFLYILSILLGLKPILFSFAVSGQIVNVSNIYMLDTIITFTVYHSMFLLGAVYFKNYNFLKTVLAIVLTFALAAILLWNLLIKVFIGEQNYVTNYIHEINSSPGELILIVSFFKVGAVALFLFLSYRQLQNRQIV